MNVVQNILTAGVRVGASALAAALLSPLAAQPYQPKWESLDQRPVPAWYRDAKFGIFIHWGVYSVPAWGAPKTYSEWYWNNMADKKPNNVWWQHHKQQYGETFEYKDFAPLFKAEHFNPDQWADLFQRSGAKYVVPTSKHHDGFCIWPSEHANKAWGRPWNSMDIGPNRDLLGELSEAVRKKGLQMGFYYSLYEWFNPLWLKDKPRYVTEHMHPQFKDVVTRYKPAIIFSDGEWDLPSSEWKSEELLAWLYNESPCKDYVIVDDRWGKETRHKHGGYYTTEYGAGMKDDTHAWEESRGIAYSYGYNRMEPAEQYKSARELVLVLCDLVSRGGNLLLDIGPTGDGRIPEIMKDRLLEMGDWLRLNGEAIYGTRHAGRDSQWSEGTRPPQGFKEYQQDYNLMDQVGQSPKGGKAVKQAFFTRKGTTLYAITPGWPGEKLEIRAIRTKPTTVVTLLGLAGTLPHQVTGDTLTVQLPNLSGDRIPGKYAFTFKISEAELVSER